MSKETDDADKLFAKIARLMALVESSNEHEARNAAWQAVRLIRSHGILGVCPEGYMHALIDGRMLLLKKDKSTSQAPPGWVEVLGGMADAADVLERAINSPNRGRARKPRNSPYKRPT